MKNAHAKPLLIRKDGSEVLLDRLPLGAQDPSQPSTPEAWLQDLLYRHPQALPVGDIDDRYLGLIPLCRELGTPAGPIDIFYVTPSGQLAVLEAKLWRNPEARRKVVAQILDYAKELSHWSYEQLDSAVRQARRREGCPEQLLGLADAVRVQAKDLDEAGFVDAVSRNLKRGEFLLLIAGDGIREGVGAITEFLEGHGTLHFTFGLIEMAIYKTPDGGRIVQPRVLARSTIVKRTVISLEGQGLVVREGPSEDGAGSEGVPEEGPPAAVQATRAFFTGFWTEFLGRLRLDDQSQPIPEPSRSTNLYFMMPTGSQGWVSASLARSSGQAWVYLTFQKGPLAEQLYERLVEQQQAIDAELGPGIQWEVRGEGKRWVQTSRLLPDLADPAARAELQAWLADMTRRFVNAFRPRIEKLLRESQ